MSSEKSWKGVWCSNGGFYVRHVYKNGILKQEIEYAFPDPRGIKYHEFPE